LSARFLINFSGRILVATSILIFIALMKFHAVYAARCQTLMLLLLLREFR